MQAEDDQNPTSNRLDRTAILLSSLCLLHCLAIPVLVAVGSIFGTWLSATESSVHWVLLALAAPISLIALWRGYSRFGAKANLIMGVIGLSLMFVGVLQWMGEHWEVALTVAGVVLLIIAHVRNLDAHRHA